MNELSLNDLREDIKQIRNYLKYIQSLDEVIDSLSYNVNSKAKQFFRFSRIEKKRFEYKALIISLYGLTEKFIESCIREYLDSLSSLIPRYEMISDKIKSSHYDLSIKLISLLSSRENSKYQDLNRDEVLINLSNCLNGSEQYKLNIEAFFILSGNLKHTKIVELFRNLDIDLNSELSKNSTFCTKLELPSNRINNIEKDVLYGKLNDLVQRRNQIAHGFEVDNILDASEIEPFVKFLEAYFQAIFDILVYKFIDQEKRYNFQRIDTIIDIYNNQVLAFEIENYILKVGDFIIIENKERNLSEKKRILEIQSLNQSYLELEVNDRKKVAIRVDPKIKKNHIFYLAKQN